MSHSDNHLIPTASDGGYCEGDTCNRNGCAGKIQMHESENCSCHINPPCSSCTSPRNFCGECGWEEVDDPAPEPAPPSKEELAAWAAQREMWKPRTLSDLDGTKIDWIHQSHTHFSMIKEGVYPAGVTAEELRKKIDGTFGGRFEYLYPPKYGRPGKFKYIAYTD